MLEFSLPSIFIMCGSRGGTGGPYPHPLEITKICWAIIGTPAKRHLIDSGILILPPLIKLKKKTLSKLDPLSQNFLDPRMFIKINCVSVIMSNYFFYTYMTWMKRALSYGYRNKESLIAFRAKHNSRQGRRYNV